MTKETKKKINGIFHYVPLKTIGKKPTEWITSLEGFDEMVGGKKSKIKSVPKKVKA